MALKDLKAENVVVKEQTYTISQFPFREGVKLQSKLAKYLGPVYGIFQSAQDEADVMEVLPKAVDALTDKLDENELVTLMERLLSRTYIQGTTPVDLDQHFSNDYMAAFELIYHVVKVNFGGFFKDLTGKLGTQDQSESQTTNT